MSKPNPYCEVLGIGVPRLEVVKDHREANYYSLLIVALLERGEPITLEATARRFEGAGVADQERSLASLKRCKPDRPPIYRDGNLYALDPHDDLADLWVFRLGLRPPKAVPFSVVKPEPAALPFPDEPLSVHHLDEAWREGIPIAWSAQRMAICVLDTHRRAMKSHEVLGFVRGRKLQSMLSEDSARYWRRDAPIRVHGDDLWELDVHHDAVRSARQAVRERIELVRRWAHMQPNPALMEANRKRIERQRQAHAGRRGDSTSAEESSTSLPSFSFRARVKSHDPSAMRWSRGQLGFVAKEPVGWRSLIVDDGGYVIDEDDIQLARLADSTAISS